ncbi:MAG: nucleotidyltransferase domain-containing protein [Firmicutes bacterium]|nr:nucleotidyltransferase domain-containing protein [Bacillota bacterium]
MLPYTIDEIKRRVTPVAKKYNLAAVYLFGSYARGEATAESDIDLLVDLTGSSVRGFIFGGLYNDLEEALETEIDLITVACLNQPAEHAAEKQFNETVMRERMMIYAAA